MTVRAWMGAALALAALAAAVPNAAAQEVRVRAVVEGGLVVLDARRSFEAITGSRSGPVWGGGLDVVLADRIGVGVRVARIERAGERVFPFRGTVIPLGVPTTIRVTPIELTGTYRLVRGRVVPYAGGGVGWHHYAETSPGADPGENVEDSFVGYHVAGGAEVRVTGWLRLAGEAGWATVPGALTGGVADTFGESDLGGTTLRLRVIIGR